MTAHDNELVEMLEQLDTKLQHKFTQVNDRMTAIEQKGVGARGAFVGTGQETLGLALTRAEGFRAYATKESRRLRAEITAGLLVKNTILGEGGSPQDPVDTIAHYHSVAGIVGGAFRQLSLLDVLPRGPASSNIVHYTREANFTNGAAETREAAQKPEATMTFEAIDAPVRTIAHFIKTSRQVMDDQPALQAYIDQRMRHGVLQRLEAQVIAGNGTSPNLAGFTAAGNHTDLSIITADNDLDALSRAKYQVIASDYRPDFYLLNPADWGRIERKKTGISGDETPVLGSGGVAGYVANGAQPRAWGLPVILSNAVAAGKFFCMARDAVMLWERQNASVEIFDQNEDDVEKNLLTIRAEGRFALSVFKPAAVIYGDLPEAD